MIGFSERRWGTGAVALAAALGLWLTMLALAAVRAGAFDYPLDDVYIHLAMAEGIAAGGYGVNPGEIATASSSILYPFLLVPFAGSAVQWTLPLAWNLAALTASAVLWAAFLGDCVARHGLPRRAALMLAVAAPLAFNLSGVAVTGMENALHGTATLAVLVGLLRFLDTGRIGWFLVLGIVLGPALRFEGLAPSLAAAGIVFLAGRRPAGLGLAAAAIAPVAAFAAALTAMGVDPVPNSLLVKLDIAETARSVGAMRIVDRFVGNLSDRPAQVLLAVALATAAAASFAWRRGRRSAAAVGLWASSTSLAHLGLGRFGWLDRYEHYILAAAIGATVMLASPHLARSGRGVAAVALALPLLLLALHYLANYAARGQWASRALILQQTQMARFSQDVLAAPVAVNDLGRVAWRNPHHVLDLWGLASRDALTLRRSDPAPGWAAPLATRVGAEVAMIYDPLLRTAPGADWIRLGQLDLEGPAGYLVWRQVAFWATSAAAADRAGPLLRDWAAALPDGAFFTFDRPE